MTELSSAPGDVFFTVTIKRAETGKEEVYNVIGTLVNNIEENENGSNPLNSSERCSD